MLKQVLINLVQIVLELELKDTMLKPIKRFPFNLAVIKFCKVLVTFPSLKQISKALLKCNFAAGVEVCLPRKFDVAHQCQPRQQNCRTNCKIS